MEARGFDAMLDHRCDIYHIIPGEASPGHGLPGGAAFAYPKVPDIAAQRCHFHVRSSALTQARAMVRQHGPYTALEGRVKLSVPIDTDIRLNDKIVHRESGYEYTAEAPGRIRGHHITVMLRRTARQARL